MLIMTVHQRFLIYKPYALVKEFVARLAEVFDLWMEVEGAVINERTTGCRLSIKIKLSSFVSHDILLELNIGCNSTVTS
jgi:hypothetical protein